MPDPACPRCGVTDPDAPCTGDPSHGSRPLKYRHAGRVPPRKTQARLEAPSLRGDLWDTDRRPE